MDYRHLTPETIEKLYQFVQWFIDKRTPKTPPLQIQPALKSSKGYQIIGARKLGEKL